MTDPTPTHEPHLRALLDALADGSDRLAHELTEARAETAVAVARARAADTRAARSARVATVLMDDLLSRIMLLVELLRTPLPGEDLLNEATSDPERCCELLAERDRLEDEWRSLIDPEALQTKDI